MSVDPEAPQGGTNEGGSGTAENGAGEGQGFDLSPIMERLSAFDSRLDQFSERLPQQEQQQGQVQEPDPFAGVDELYDDPEAAAQVREVLQGIVTGAVQQQFQQQVGPLAQQFQQLRNELDMGELEEKYPELQRDQAVAQEVTQRAAQLAQRLGNPGLMYDREIIEMAYLASRAQRAAGSEGPAGGANPASLESAAGSAPGEQEPNWAKEIVSGAKQSTGLFGF